MSESTPRQTETRSSNERIVVVSNRLPIVLEQDGDDWQVRQGSGGLVQALGPILRQRGGRWVGWPGVTEDAGDGWRETATESAREAGYDLVPVPLTQDDLDGFYRGFANSVLWPLFHDFLDRCDFDPDHYEAYRRVNRRFAEALADATEPGELIWVQDYQLIHVGADLRAIDAERGSEGEPGERRICFFLHTPFPPLDIFVKLPWRESLLDALVAYDLVGFQTDRDRRNFLSCLEHLGRDYSVAGDGSVVEVKVGERTIHVGSFPISIDFEAFDRAARSERALERMERLKAELGEDTILVLGVDRLDYTKGIPQRLEAFQRLLERRKDLREKVVFFQISVPSREAVSEYRSLRQEIERQVGEINGRFATPGWVPVRYHYRSVRRNTLIALYRLARIAFVTPLKDGMNLVAKEYCACHPDDDGVLVLSEFAGAAAQLGPREGRGAVMVNPYDVVGMAKALDHALDLGADERRERMKTLRAGIREQDVYQWAERYLSAALGRELEPLPGEREYLPELDIGSSDEDDLV